MNKLYTLLLLSTISFVTICFNGYSQNLVQNAGFETATNPMPYGNSLPPYPATFGNWSAVNTDGEMIKDASLAHSGTGFLSLLQNAGANMLKKPWLGVSVGGGYDRAVQIVSVSPSTSYTLQFWVRSGKGLRYSGYSDGYALFQVEQFQPTNQVMDSLSLYISSSTWQLVSMNFTTGPSCTSIAVLLSCFSPTHTDIWFDNLQLQTSGVKPTAEFKSSDTVFCNEGGSCINFFDYSAGSPTSWHWYFPGGFPDTSTMQNPTAICYSVPGVYPVTLIVTNGAGADTINVPAGIIYGSGPAAPVISLSNDTLYCSPAASYQWYFNGYVITGATSSFYLPLLYGNYNVYVTDSLGCGRLGSNFLFVGMNELTNNNFVIFPNPATEYIEISGLKNEKYSVEVFNVIGEKLYAASIKPSGQSLTFRLNFKQFEKGIYFVSILSGENLSVQKIVIE